MAVSAHLLTLGLTGLRRLDPRLPYLLTSRLALDTRRTFGTNLLALNAGRALRPSLLTFNASRSFSANLLALDTGRTLGPNLLALHARRAFNPSLLALDSSWTLRPHLDALGALRPFGTHRLLTLRPRLLARLSLLAFGARGLSVLLGPRIGRGRDRQRGDARGEKYPGHHKFSFSTA